MVSTGATPTVSAVGIYEPVMTTGFMTIAFVSWASAAVVPRRVPIRPTSMSLLRPEGIFFCRCWIITLVGFSLRNGSCRFLTKSF